MTYQLTSATDALEQAGRFYKVAARLDHVLAEVRQLAVEDAGRHLDLRSFAGDVSRARMQLMRAAPLEYCNCENPRKCNRCKGTRWLTAEMTLDQDGFEQQES